MSRWLRATVTRSSVVTVGWPLCDVEAIPPPGATAVLPAIVESRTVSVAGPCFARDVEDAAAITVAVTRRDVVGVDEARLDRHRAAVVGDPAAPGGRAAGDAHVVEHDGAAAVGQVAPS